MGKPSKKSSPPSAFAKATARQAGTPRLTHSGNIPKAFLPQDGMAYGEISEEIRELVRSWDDKTIGLSAMDIQLGGNVARPPATLTSAEVPKDIQRAQKLAWNYYCDSSFLIRPIVDMRSAFYGFGCQVLVKDKAPTPKMVEQWQKKLKNFEEYCDGAVLGNVMDHVGRYISDSIRDIQIYDAVVSYWHGVNKIFTLPFPVPHTIQPFKCTYTSAGGYPKLKIALDWDKQDLPGSPLNYQSGQQERQLGFYAQNDAARKLKVSGERDKEEHWSVFSEGAFGFGFGRPSMAAIFRPLGQSASMEAGETQIGYLARSPIRQTQLGHETRYGPYAGTAANFVTKKRWEQNRKILQPQQGFMDMTTNFDHKIIYHWIDPKWFDASKWQTIIQRIIWWGGPAAWMFVTKSINPFLFPIFMREAQDVRRKVISHVQPMLALALDADDLTVKFSDTCFTDQRLMLDMMKFLVAQGPMSTTTALEWGGMNPETETENKEKEAKKPLLRLPIFNKGGQGSGAASSGGAGPKNEGGRPHGAPDPD